jgi:hypothetical protein
VARDKDVSSADQHELTIYEVCFAFLSNIYKKKIMSYIGLLLKEISWKGSMLQI